MHLSGGGYYPEDNEDDLLLRRAFAESQYRKEIRRIDRELEEQTKEGKDDGQ